MSERISATLRQAVAERAHHHCEYCGMPDSEVLAPHEPDHIIAVQHGGGSQSENLAYACFQCNRMKGSNIASLDPDSGRLVALFNPRTQPWTTHFRLDGPLIVARTATGRVTVSLLRLNDPERMTIRANLLRLGRYPLSL